MCRIMVMTLIGSMSWNSRYIIISVAPDDFIRRNIEYALRGLGAYKTGGMVPIASLLLAQPEEIKGCLRKIEYEQEKHR